MKSRNYEILNQNSDAKRDYEIKANICTYNYVKSMI